MTLRQGIPTSGIFKKPVLQQTTGFILLLFSRKKILQFKAFFIISMNGHTAMIRYWPGHGCYSCDNARCRVITENSVCGFTIFPSSTKDIDFSITHRHATVLLFQENTREYTVISKARLDSCVSAPVQEGSTVDCLL